MLKSLSTWFGSAELEQLLSPQAKVQEIFLKRNLFGIALALIIWLAFGVCALLIYSFTICYTADQCASTGWNVFSIGSFLALASASAGGLLGFLFGIPRTLAKEPLPNKDKGQTTQNSVAEGTQTGSKDARRLSVNTNLEEISDWLTKILVGAGLVQLQNIPSLLHKAGLQFQSSLGNSELAVLGIVINFSVWGFFSGYLLTRLFLAGAFRLADEGNLADLNTQEVRTALKVGDALREIKQYSKARLAYEQALAKINETTPKEEKRKVYEGIVFNSLYDNYEDAIEYALRYIAEEPKTPSALIYAYLAFAYGQMFKDKKVQKDKAVAENRSEDANRLQAEMAQTRLKALEAIKQALKIDPNKITLIRMVFDPNHPAKSPEDDDLEVFKGDKEFDALIG
jgi:tetratricopeptide (TPR) repeat protein